MISGVVCGDVSESLTKNVEGQGGAWRRSIRPRARERSVWGAELACVRRSRGREAKTSSRVEITGERGEEKAPGEVSCVRAMRRAWRMFARVRTCRETPRTGGAADGAGAPVRQDESPARVTPLAPERFALQLTIGEETQAKLVRAQALLRHQVPSGDLAEVLDRALDALLDKVEARKFGKTKRPRAAKASRVERYVGAGGQARGGGARRNAMLVRLGGRAAVRGDGPPRARPRGAGGARRRGDGRRRACPLSLARPVRGGTDPGTRGGRGRQGSAPLDGAEPDPRHWLWNHPVERTRRSGRSAAGWSDPAVSGTRGRRAGTGSGRGCARRGRARGG
jgi:hypothetical protein